MTNLFLYKSHIQIAIQHETQNENTRKISLEIWQSRYSICRNEFTHDAQRFSIEKIAQITAITSANVKCEWQKMERFFCVCVYVHKNMLKLI